MTIRFAAPPRANAVRTGAREAQRGRAPAANDNHAEQPSDTPLRAALRHFAGHGLAAAHLARKQAETAFFAGDRQAYQWWLEICRVLDRRMARELAAETPESA